MMAALWTAVAALIIGALALLSAPLARRGRAAAAAGRVDYDISVYKDQLKEVDQDRERGFLDEAEAEAARIEIQRRLLAADSGEDAGEDQEIEVIAKPADTKSNIVIMVIIAVAVPLGAVFMYLGLGQPGVRDYPLAGRADETSPAISRQDQEMVAQLAERLRQNPNDQKGWLLLGHSYMAMEQYADAAKAYRKALEVGDKRLDIALNYAEALVFGSDAAMPDEAVKIFRQVRDAAPREPKSRYYLGLNMAQTGDLRGALQEWVDLRALSSKDAPYMGMLEGQISNAAKELKVDPASVKPSSDAPGK